MLSLDTRAAAVLSVLKRGQKPYGDLARDIDGLSRDDLAARVHRINREAGYELVVSRHMDGDRVYSLADPSVEWEVLSSVQETARDLSHLRSEVNWKLVLIFFVVVLII